MKNNDIAEAQRIADRINEYVRLLLNVPKEAQLTPGIGSMTGCKFCPSRCCFQTWIPASSARAIKEISSCFKQAGFLITKSPDQATKQFMQIDAWPPGLNFSEL
jgi:hypothetical protein